MRIENDDLRVLSVGCPVTGDDDTVAVIEVDCERAALNAVKRGRFDLLLSDESVNGLPVWPLVRDLRRLRPKLNWWLVAHGIKPADEVLARTLGVTRILSSVPTREQIRQAWPSKSPLVRLEAHSF